MHRIIILCFIFCLRSIPFIPPLSAHPACDYRSWKTRHSVWGAVDFGRLTLLATGSSLLPNIRRDFIRWLSALLFLEER